MQAGVSLKRGLSRADIILRSRGVASPGRNKVAPGHAAPGIMRDTREILLAAPSTFFHRALQHEEERGLPARLKLDGERGRG